MKKLLILSAAFICAGTSLLAQTTPEDARRVIFGKRSTSKETTTSTPTGTTNTQKKTDSNQETTHEGGSNNGSKGHKSTTNLPAPVRAAFTRDYPNASSVSWTKSRGDWTASFNHGSNRSTAVYHANGERRGATTAGTRSQPSRGNGKKAKGK